MFLKEQTKDRNEEKKKHGSHSPAGSMVKSQVWIRRHRQIVAHLTKLLHFRIEF